MRGRRERQHDEEGEKFSEVSIGSALRLEESFLGALSDQNNKN
jgi:hypothetical protein